jgi:hypothetical protein
VATTCSATAPSPTNVPASVARPFKFSNGATRHRIIARSSSHATARSTHLNLSCANLNRVSSRGTCEGACQVHLRLSFRYSNIPSRASPISLARNEVEKRRPRVARENRPHATYQFVARYTHCTIYKKPTKNVALGVLVARMCLACFLGRWDLEKLVPLGFLKMVLYLPQ